MERASFDVRYESLYQNSGEQTMKRTTWIIIKGIVAFRVVIGGVFTVSNGGSSNGIY